MGLPGVDPVPKGSEICWAVGKYKMSRGQAKKTARRMQKREKVLMNEYLCPGCGYWHVGKVRGRRG